MSPEVRYTLERMLAATLEALEYASVVDNIAEWKSNGMARRAVERCLINLGEEASSLRKFSDIQFEALPTNKITGFRNRLVHDYLRLDDVTVYEIIRDDCPRIVGIIQNILDQNK